MDLHEYLRVIRRRWALLVACVLVSAGAAWVVTPAQPSQSALTYSATHQLLRDSSAAAPQALATVALLVRTGEVPERAADRLEFSGKPALLAAGLDVEADEQVGTLTITATAGSRAQAVEKANVFAEETLALLGERSTEQQQEQIASVNEEITTLQAELDILDQEILEQAGPEGEAPATLRAQRDSKLRQYGAALDLQQQVLDQPPPSAGYITLQPALTELASVEEGGFAAPSSREARTAIAAVVGLLLGGAAVLLMERLDTRIHEVSGLADAFALPVIAEVPAMKVKRRERILATDDPMSALAESYRTLRSALLLAPITPLGLGLEKAAREGEPKVVLVTSASPSDGKTTTAANLAVMMAESGRRVLLLGCDFRRPELHEVFDRPVEPGVADVLSGRVRSLADVVLSTDVPGVFLAPSGKRLHNLGDVAAGGQILLDEARDLADIVIVDTAPALATNEASELIPACDAVVVVARIDKTTIDGARRTRFLLDRLSAPVAGIVAVGVTERSGAYSGYGAYYTSGEKRSRKDAGVHPADPEDLAYTPPEQAERPSSPADGTVLTVPSSSDHPESS